MDGAKVDTPIVDDNLENMSDEDFAQLESLPVTETVENSNDGETLTEAESSVEDSTEEDKTANAQEDTQEKEETQPNVNESPAEEPADIGGESNIDSPAEDSALETPAVDYEAEYKKIMAPFKANGVDLQIRNSEDVIRLMQMGAGFHNKMAALKPVRKIVKLLEKHNLIDPAKLNYLIDLADKKPAAISQLLRDAQIDPLDIDLKDETGYTPTQRTVSDIELELDTVLEEIQHTPTYSKTLTTLTRDWDESSQNTIAATPHIIKVINGHMQDGTFDKVMGAVNYERSLGRLQGMSDFDAYKSVGDMLYQQGQLTLNGQPKATSQQSIPNQPATVNKPSPIQEKTRQKAKQAAKPTKTSGSLGQQSMSLATLSEMSDEDFEKINLKDLQTT